MKVKNLIPLVLVLVVLVAVAVYKKSTVETPSIIEQTGLVALLPDGLSKSDITKLELYTGGLPEEENRLVLAFDADKDMWRVSSHFNAPVKQDVIDKYLKDLVELKGEVREQNAPESAIAEYDLTEDKAFHVCGFKKDGTEPFFHVLVGKAPSQQTVFLRKEGSNDVFVENTNLKQQAGIYGNASDENAEPKAPEATMWLDKKIIELDTEKITKVDLALPDKSLVFEKHEKPKPTEEKEDEEEPAEETEPEYEWVLASGGPGTPAKPNKIEDLIKKFGSLNASDVMDPNKKDEWGLASPAYTCVISMDGQDDVRIEAARPDPSKDGYLRVATATEDFVYSLSKYTFEQIFPKGTDMFDLKGLTLDKKNIERIELTQAEGNVVIGKGSPSFSLLAPEAPLEPQTNTIDTIATTLASWKPADYAKDDPGLGESTRMAIITAGGTVHTLKVYGDSKHIDGVYVRLDNESPLLVMSRADLGKIFANPKDLYKRALLDLDEEEIEWIGVSGAAGMYDITRDGENWKLTVDGNKVDALTESCDNLASEIAALEASNILFGKKELDGPVENTIRVRMKDGTEHVVTIGPEANGIHQLMVSGKAQAFEIEHTTATALLPSVDTLKKPEPETPPAEEETTPAPAEPGEEASAPAAELPIKPAEEKPGETTPPTQVVAPEPAPEPITITPNTTAEEAPPTSVVVSPAPEATPETDTPSEQ